MPLEYILESNTNTRVDDSIVDDYLDGKLSKNSDTNEKCKTNLRKEEIIFGEDVFYVCALYVEDKHIHVLKPRKVSPINLLTALSPRQDFLTKIYEKYGVGVFKNQLFGHTLNHVYFFDGMEECVDHFRFLIKSMKKELHQALDILSLYEEQHNNDR